ncbi:MAG: hypothetical protein AB7P31_05615 [Steroidobacteraceae bacterium]
MDNNEASAGARTPWHLWAVGIVALLWMGMGALDYVMTQTRNASYLSAFTPAQLDYFYGFPAWVVAAWAIGVWGGVLGAILLLLRRRLALWAFAASLAATVLATFHNYVLSNGLEVVGDAVSLVFTAVIVVVAVALVVYARALTRQRLLR